jgi:hypothetical protein
MAHGLINDDGFLSPLMSYLWWLTLRLCCLPMIIYQQKVEQSNPWVKFAGMFKDDPLFDEFVEEMAAYRRELDAEINTEEGFFPSLNASYHVGLIDDDVGAGSTLSLTPITQF